MFPSALSPPFTSLFLLKPLGLILPLYVFLFPPSRSFLYLPPPPPSPSPLHAYCSPSPPLFRPSFGILASLHYFSTHLLSSFPLCPSLLSLPFFQPFRPIEASLPLFPSVLVVLPFSSFFLPWPSPPSPLPPSSSNLRVTPIPK